jgi:murein DD-endopeptidase MepM/ murein hydrolase activator NlpD
MARLRFGIRTTTTTALALAALAAPAAATPTRNQEDGPARVGFAGLRAWSEAGAPQRVPGPVLPLIGKPDFGTAENAFGAARSGHTHEGQDILAPAGTPLVAATDSVIAEAGSDGSQGNYVYLYDRRRDRTYVYMHMIAPAIVGAGDDVRAGERVGSVGCTGSCWGDHLHFEVRDGRGIGGEAHDPLPMLKRWKFVDEPR